MQSTKYGASEGAKSKWADVEVAEYQPGGGHVGDNLQQFKRTVPQIFLLKCIETKTPYLIFSGTVSLSRARALLDQN